MPTFSAVQAWAPEDHRARVIAAVNVVGAGFMTVGGGLVAAIQAAGVSIAAVLLGLALLNAAAAWLMLKYLPTNAFRDFVSILFRAFHRLEVEGLENLKAAGPAPILALNHVSFLDGPLALTLTDEEPVFAIDYTIAQAWWMKPFLKLTRALPLNPAKPMSTRTLIKIVQGGDPLVIFPEGRITVTGGLMKVYDGAAMVADKTGSMVVPVRIEGLEKSYFSRLTSLHVRRQLFPKVKVTILPPVRLAVAARAEGAQAPRGGRCGALPGDVGPRLPHPEHRQDGAREDHPDGARARHEHAGGAGSDHRLAELRQIADRRSRARREIPHALRRPEDARHHAAERQRLLRDAARRHVGGQGAGDDQLHRRRGEHTFRLQGGRSPDHPHVPRLRRAGEARRDGRRARPVR